MKSKLQEHADNLRSYQVKLEKAIQDAQMAEREYIDAAYELQKADAARNILYATVENLQSHIHNTKNFMKEILNAG